MVLHYKDPIIIIIMTILQYIKLYESSISNRLLRFQTSLIQV